MDTTTVTVIIITGAPVPLDIRELLKTLGKVMIVEELEFPESDAADAYTYSSLIITGKKVPLWLRRMLGYLGSVTIAEQEPSEHRPDSLPHKYVQGQPPPLYIHHAVEMFHPDLFLRLVMSGYSLFTDKISSIRIENGITHLYSLETKMYASMKTWLFLQWFQGSGKPSFTSRVHQILSMKLEFITEPVQIEVNEALTRMKWREALLNLGGG